MLLIHLPIALVEGVVTAALLAFVARARPSAQVEPGVSAPRRLVGSLLALALLAGGVLSWLASSRPDGLEWSLARQSGTAELQVPVNPLHRWAARLQQQTALLPDYAFQDAEAGPASTTKAGSALSGLLGGTITLLLVAGAGWFLARRRRAAQGPG